MHSDWLKLIMGLSTSIHSDAFGSGVFFLQCVLSKFASKQYNLVLNVKSIRITHPEAKLPFKVLFQFLMKILL